MGKPSRPTSAIEQNPWLTQTRRTVYDNPWIRVEEHEVVNPAGKPGIYGKVCFKSRAVAVIALEATEQLVLVGQYRYTLDEYSWELPMGGAALDEDVLAAARRELAEETGLAAAEWAHLMRLHTSNSITDEEAHVFLARDLTEGAASPGETEQLAVRRIALAEALAWIRAGRITDAVSVAGLLGFAAEAQVRDGSRHP
jgi:8-oxo-dGTP pyrophosphatase MutT (NUDIX family)